MSPDRDTAADHTADHADWHAIGRRWVENGEALTALAREHGIPYTSLYGKLRALGYTLEDAVGARPGRRPRDTDAEAYRARTRNAELAWAEQQWAVALGRRRFADARVPPPRGRLPALATLVERSSSMADLSS